MPLKLLKGETIDQVLAQFDEWEKNAMREKQEQWQQQRLLNPNMPPVGLAVGEIHVLEDILISWVQDSLTGKPDRQYRGYGLLFLHN